MAGTIDYNKIYKKLTDLLKNYEAQLNKDLLTIEDKIQNRNAQVSHAHEDQEGLICPSISRH